MELLSIIIDLVLVVIVISSILNGRKNGFVKMVLSIVATIVSILVGRELAEPVAMWIKKAFVHDRIVGSIENAISSSVADGTQAVAESIPNYLVKAGEAVGVSADRLIADIGSSVSAAEIAESICVAAEKAFINGALIVVSFCVIYAISSFVLSFAVSAVNRIFKLPILRAFNKTLGAVLGGAKGIVAVFVVSGIIGFVAMFIENTAFVQAVEQTVIQQNVWETIISFFE
ncbi:MAG: CvpA family protein [Clostridia bacterium]|nr:CvpA family protein [Clostridia bacterium]